MDDALPVRRREGVRDLRRHRQRLRPAAAALLQPLGERLAREVLHHEEGRAVVLADVVQGADVWVAQAGDGPGLALEPGAAVRVGADLGGRTLMATVRSRRVSRAL